MTKVAPYLFKISFHLYCLLFCLNCNRLITLGQQQDAKEGLCNICYCSIKLKVLKCGHAFCFSCLETIHAISNGKISCSFDGIEDKRRLQALPTPDQSNRKVLNTWVVETVVPNFERLIADLVEYRKATIKHLRDVAELLNSRELKCAISKVSGTAATVRCIGNTPRWYTVAYFIQSLVKDNTDQVWSIELKLWKMFATVEYCDCCRNIASLRIGTRWQLPA